MERKRAIAELIKILNTTREFLLRPENDYPYSGWDDVQIALEEFDALVELLKKNDLPNKLKLTILFAPTGPIQELSNRSGGGEEFTSLANDFDTALANVYE